MPRKFRKISQLGRRNDPPRALKSGDRVFITNRDHPWFEQAGTLVSFETYGLGWTGWRTNLDNGFNTYVKAGEVRTA